MGKRPSLKYQITQSLIKQKRFGESKYEAKRAGNVKFGQPVDGIFSYKTMKVYLDEAVRFVNWVKENYKVKTLEEAKKYVGEYLEEGKERKLSAWTLKLQRSALRKAFQDSELAKEVQLPDRRKENIVRSRGDAVRDKNFSEERNKDMVDFAKATGLRRSGMSKVRVRDVFEMDGGKLFVATREKGGRYREAPVLEKYTERVREIIHGKDPDEEIFGKIHSSADIHSYRREYAQELYREITGESYDPAKDKDKEALQQVSEALGHSRLDVVTRNYL
ncbi:tyrosine-type recombinase/integrase [Peptococcaceae bacterium]|nr:tyrosine-type recombinase/integrase [Peptococcaceae bacterium]